MYKINKVIFNKLHSNHVPYLLGILVEGPRGGKYFLDCFNTETLLKTYFGMGYSNFVTNLVQDAIDRSKYKIEKEYITIKYDTEKEMLAAIRRKYKAVILSRLDGKETTLKISKKFSL